MSPVCVSEGPISKEMNLPREENMKFYFTLLKNNLMFLGGVYESDMSLIKEVIDCVLKPFTNICPKKKSIPTSIF